MAGEGVVDAKGAALQATDGVQVKSSNTSKAFDKSFDKSAQLEGLIYKFNSDQEYGVFENYSDAVTTLPSSLFYEAQSSEDGRVGLFNYYVIGDIRSATDGKGKVTYIQSERYEQNQVVTPEVSRNPTANAIIKETTANGAYLNPRSKYVSQPYNVKDFIFCKHYGVIPNNRMITLRRFPNPVMDNLRVPTPGKRIEAVDKAGEVKGQDVDGASISTEQMIKEGACLPIAQAVTFFGTETGNSLDSILGIDIGLNWGPNDQDKLKKSSGNDKGFMQSTLGKYIEALSGGPGSKLSEGLKSISSAVGVITDPDNVELRHRRALYDTLVAPEGPLTKRIFVDVNTVNKMWMREIGFNGGDQTFSLTFNYSLTSVGEINSRMMFIDLMANLLAIGSDYGKFLVPQLLVGSNKQGIGFPNGSKGFVKHLTDPVGFLNDMLKLNFEAEVKAKVDSISGTLEKSKNEIQGLSKGEALPKDGQVYKTLTAMLTSDLINQLVYEPIMLSGYPTGEWHVVVGNPLNPIAMIGNLICTNVKIKLNNVLGPDDFPTELTATFSMKAARQKHRGDFESMFNRGNGRLYLGKMPISDASLNAQVGALSGNDIQGPLPDNTRDVGYMFASPAQNATEMNNN
jgi:hypothetical protein